MHLSQLLLCFVSHLRNIFGFIRFFFNSILTVGSIVPFSSSDRDFTSILKSNCPPPLKRFRSLWLLLSHLSPTRGSSHAKKVGQTRIGQPLLPTRSRLLSAFSFHESLPSMQSLHRPVQLAHFSKVFIRFTRCYGPEKYVFERARAFSVLRCFL